MRAVRFALLLAATVAVVACHLIEAPPMPGMLNRSRAIEIAAGLSPAGAELVAATFAEAVDAGVRDAPSGFVWRIAFRIDEVRPCGPAPGGQLCRIESRVVYLDGATGNFLEAEESGSQVVPP